jgi:C4-dicarboxylate-specific signal transduction histidine kinase
MSRHLGQMAMMTEIASALVHEIKLPVTAIRLNALAGATLLGSPRTAFDASVERQPRSVADVQGRL